MKKNGRASVRVRLNKLGRQILKDDGFLPITVQAYISDGFDVAYRTVGLPLTFGRPE